MADKQDQKKKDGERKDKKVKRSVEASEARHRAQHAEGQNSDQGDIMQFKPGSENDRTSVGGKS